MKIKAFKGIRPKKDLVSQVASRPYDVLNTQEAREEAGDNRYSFLRVVKPEITLPPETDPHSPSVYEAGKKNFAQLLADGVFSQDTKDCLYLYELVMEGRSQNGIVACAAVDDYMNGRIKKHELTRPDKEEDRKNHVRIAMINAEPVFFAYKHDPVLAALVAEVKQVPPEYDFTADDGIVHRLWVIEKPGQINAVVSAFEKMPATYVADGHHRTAAAALVGNELRAANKHHTGNESYNYFLAVHFPDNELAILDYNRVVKDLNGHTASSFLEALEKSFTVTPKGTTAYRPAGLHEMGMYLENNWYALNARPGTYDDADPIGVLDVTILSKQILEPLLGIHDLRTDKRIDFVGGMRGLEELERRVNNGEMKVAFALYPVSMKQLIDIADSGAIMPPKTTWFEPKLRSGLVVHSLEDE